MSVSSVRSKATEIIMNQGRAVIHSMYPDDFEYYACSLLIEDSTGKMVDLFNFPVMPHSISINKRPLVNIKKTARGYSNQFSTSFSGDNISINGTFGRKFRLLLTDEIKKPNKEDFSLKGMFDAKVKTGYGALKMMEKILFKSTQLDNNFFPHKLFFINYSFNEMFYVEVLNWTKSQSLESNFMWNYSLEMKALAVAKSQYQETNRKAKLTSLLGTASTQRIFNNTFNNLTFGGATDVLRGDI